MNGRLNELLERHGPKHWALAARKDPAFVTWVMQQTESLPNGLSFAERVYAACTNTTPVCHRGNIRKFKNVHIGWGFCGRTGICPCARESVSASVSASKAMASADEVAETNRRRQVTNLKRYGVTNIGRIDAAVEAHRAFYADTDKVKEATEKGRQTMLERHGVPNALVLPEVLAARPAVRAAIPEATKKRAAAQRKAHAAAGGLLMASYNNLKRKFVDRGLELLTDIEHYTGVAGQTYYQFRCLRCNLSFETYISNKPPKCPICDKKKPSYKSMEENEVLAYLQSLGLQVVQTNRRLIRYGEIDLFIPDRNLAVEYCGLYWHSDFKQGRGKDYHLRKVVDLEKRGIRLVTIFSDEWLNKQEICQARLRHIAGCAEKPIYARRTQVADISAREANGFLKQHHIQGPANGASVNMGLMHDGQLVAVMTFGALRRTHNQQGSNGHVELYRFASSTQVVGGASKLFKNFLRQHDPLSVASYCDRRWGSGGVYRQMGFSELEPTQPGYWWTEKHLVRYHRYSFNKHTLVEQGFDPAMTEEEIMRSRGFDRIWDCGNLKFLWTKPDKS